MGRGKEQSRVGRDPSGQRHQRWLLRGHRGFLGLLSLGLLASGVVAPVAAAAAEPPAKAVGRPPAAWRFDLPPGFPAPRVPAANPISAEKVALGRALFFDRRLSGTGNFACASCHQPALAFTDGRARAVGATGQQHPRSAMSLANVAYNVTLTWAHPGLVALEDQALVPMMNQAPIELGIRGHEQEVLARLAAVPGYRRRFAAAFPSEPDMPSMRAITRALASFERTLISGTSPYDRYVYRDQRDALSEAAVRGKDLFFSPRLGCSGCHAGFTFSGPVQWAGSRDRPPVFHNTGLYNLRDAGGRRGAYPADNPGLIAHTGRIKDMGKFRAPTLRNIAVTAPYMHDGSVATLGAVIDHYARGGRARSKRTSKRLHRFVLSAGQKQDLIAFLESLTDEAFLHDPRFADPWPGAAQAHIVAQAAGQSR